MIPVDGYRGRCVKWWRKWGPADIIAVRFIGSRSRYEGQADYHVLLHKVKSCHIFDGVFRTFRLHVLLQFQFSHCYIYILPFQLCFGCLKFFRFNFTLNIFSFSKCNPQLQVQIMLLAYHWVISLVDRNLKCSRMMLYKCQFPLLVFSFPCFWILIRRKGRCGVFAGNFVWSTSERLVVEILTIGAIQVRFLSFPFLN